MKIGIIDDEELLVKGISYNLESEGYEVVVGTDGAQAVAIAADPEIKLMILDVMMPVMDGLEACRRIRQFSDVPIIMLTAKAEDMDKLLGFDHGADDYLTKPFNILELKARIRAILRRSGKQSAEGRITRGSITLDPQSRNTYKGGTPVELTAKEFDLVELLIRNPNRLTEKEELYRSVWGAEAGNDLSVLHTTLSRLNRKLEPAGKRVICQRGEGYMLEEI